MLEMVLQNVLENAISFSPRGGTIIVTLTRNSETVELQVDDEGPGVDPAKDRLHVRALFLVAPAQRRDVRPAFRHAGLGLWIVRRNVEALGGGSARPIASAAGSSISVSCRATATESARNQRMTPELRRPERSRGTCSCTSAD